jgi:hypothetical protein
MCEIERRFPEEQYNFQKQNDIHNISHNYGADALSRHLDHCSCGDIAFLKVALQYAHNCVSTETISRTILLERKKHLI